MTQPPAAVRTGLPRSVWALGWVSLCMDLSSEMVHSLLPLFLVGTLGASVMLLGILEGFAEGIAAVGKLFSGRLSDWMGRRKPLTVIGYGLAALSKPLFPLADSIMLVFVARFTDRIGKGIRGAPRDALITDITPAAQRGAAFGLRQSLDSIGAVLGPALAVLLMLAWASDVRAVMWVACVPAAIAVAVLIAWVAEPVRVAAKSVTALPHWRDAKSFPRAFWWLVGIAALFTLARFSEAFLLLRAADLGLSAALAPVVLIVMSAVYAASAWPAGALADRVRPETVLIAGITVLIAADLLLALSTTVAAAMVGAALWGFHMGLTQGVFAKLVAAAAPAELRGTAFGFFHLISAVALLGASVLAGGLWTRVGAAATFLTGAALALAALVLLTLTSRRRRSATV